MSVRSRSGTSFQACLSQIGVIFSLQAEAARNSVAAELMIDVVLENSRGEVSERLESDSLQTNWLLMSADFSQTCCLRFIDPYVDVIFNRWQMRVLIDELKELKSTLTEHDVATAYNRWLALVSPQFASYAQKYPVPTVESLSKHIDAIIDIATRGSESYHEYLRFVGD